MDRQALKEELEKTIGDFLKGQGLELVELIYRYEGRDLFLRVLADRPEGGINLEECAGLNRDIGAMLDGKDILQQGYILEVSSPGLDRPLKTKRDFSRCVNRMVVLFLNNAVEGKSEIEGIIGKVEGESVYIDTGGVTVEVPLAKINKGKQIFYRLEKK